MAKSLPATPRRSQRFQPMATPSASTADKNVLECVWASKPIYTRRTIPELDLLPEEQEQNGLEDTTEGEGEDRDTEERETVFYEAFRMKRKATAFRGSKRMLAGKIELHTYRLGDTVMVETDTLYIMKKPPSIGVIVAMWETRAKHAEQQTDSSSMRIRIHWFLRPQEMASVRAKREHEENEVYYSLATRVVVTPAVILTRCLVSAKLDPTGKRPEPKRAAGWDLVPVTPTKRRPSSPLKKSTRFSTATEDDSEEDDSEKQVDETSFVNDPDKMFYCRLAVDSRRGIFYDFDWEKHHRDALARSKPPAEDFTPGPSKQPSRPWGEGSSWDVVEQKKPKRPTTTKAAKTRDRSDEGISESEADDSDEFEEDGSQPESDEETEIDEGDEGSEGAATDEEGMETIDSHRTPSKKRRRRADATTPRKSKRSRTLAHPTPHSKAALKRRRKKTMDLSSSPRKRRATFAIRFPEQSLAFQASMAHLPKDPWLRSMHALHVGSRPDALPCREDEYERVLRCVGELLEEGSGGCIYISGVPGTGKTATVHTIIRELKRMAQNSEINPFTYVEINGLKIPEPSAAYSLLWEGISGHDVAKEGHLRIGAKESLKALTRHFTTGNRGPEGHACVVLMDELDQLVTPKQDVVYNFFNWPTLVGSKLVVIAVANTMDLPERVMTGRVRSRLGMIRINFQPYTREQLEKIVEARLASAKEGLEDEEGASRVIIAPDAIKFASMTVSRITGDARRVLDICRRAVELVEPTKGTVKAPHVREVVNMMQNSPTAAYLRDLSFHERLMLTSLIKCVKREGIEEIKWSEVEYQHLTYMDSLTSEDDPKRKPTPYELMMVLDSLVASRAVVVEDGTAVARKPPGERRLLLNLEQGEVERVLGDVGGQRWKAVLSN